MVLTKAQYEAVVHDFVGEVWATVEGLASGPLPQELAEALLEQLQLVQEPGVTEAERVAAAFSVVNQYLDSTWSVRVDEGYRLYLDRVEQDGRST